MSILRNIDFSPREIAQRLQCKRCRWPKVSDRQVSSRRVIVADPAHSLAIDLIPAAAQYSTQSAALHLC
jgi:hypothetical protein